MTILRRVKLQAWLFRFEQVECRITTLPLFISIHSSLSMNRAVVVVLSSAFYVLNTLMKSSRCYAITPRSVGVQWIPIHSEKEKKSERSRRKKKSMEHLTKTCTIQIESVQFKVEMVEEIKQRENESFAGFAIVTMTANDWLAAANLSFIWNDDDRAPIVWRHTR